MAELKDLGEPLYLFGGMYPSTKQNGSDVYDDLNLNGDLSQTQALKDVRPLSCLPIAVNIDSESPMLWGSNEFGQLYHLGVGVQVNPCGTIPYLHL